MADIDHSIVRQTVSVGTADERTARTLQPRLAGINEAHFLPVIERVFEEFDRPGAEILIDRIVIDLGTVPFDDLATLAAGRLASELRAELARLIAGIAPDSDPGLTVLSGDEAELAVLEHYLLSGLWPSWSPHQGAANLDALVTGIAAAQPAVLGAMLYRIGRSGGVLERLVAQLDETTLERLVAALEPQHAALIVGTIAETKEAHKAEPVTDMSEEEFADRLWLMTLNYLVTEPGTQFNRREFVKSLLMGMAEEAGAQYGDILHVLRRALRKVEGRRPLRSSLPAILLDLVRDEGGLAARESFVGDALEHVADVPPGDAAAELAGATGDDGARPVSVHEASIDAGTPPQPEAWSGWSDIEADAARAIDFAAIGAQLADTAALFRRYDAADRIVRIVRGEISALQAAAGFTADGLIAALLELPAAAVHALLREAITVAGPHKAAPKRNLAQLLSAVSPHAVERLLGALLPAAMASPTFAESLRSRTAAAADRGAFYAGVVLAALEHAPLDLDALAKAAVVGGGGAPGPNRETVLAAAEALLRALPPAAAPPRERLAALMQLGRREPGKIDARSLAVLMRDALGAPVAPRPLEWLQQSLGALDRTRKYGAPVRALLRAALAEMALAAGQGATMKRPRADSAAALAALESLLSALPDGMKLPPHRMAAVMAAAEARLKRRKTAGVSDIARVIRESLAAPGTPETAAALRRAARILRAANSSPGVIVRGAVADVVRDARRDKALSRRGARLAVLAAAEALLRALPATMKQPEDRVAAMLRDAADAPQARPVDAAFLAGLIRDGLSAVTPEAVAALRHAFNAIDRGRRFSARTRVILRDAIADIAGDVRRAGDPEPVAGRAAVVAAIEALLRLLPDKVKRPADWIAALLLAAGARASIRPVDTRFMASLIQASLADPITAATVELMRRAMGDAGTLAQGGQEQRRLLREAIEWLERGIDESADALGRGTSAADSEETARHAAAEAFLAAGRRTGTAAGAALAAAIDGLIAHAPARALAATRAGASRRRTVTAWSRHLPAPALARLTAILAPRRHRLLIETAERLAASLQEQLAGAARPAYRRRDLWRYVLRFAAAHGNRPWAPRDVLTAFIRTEVTPRLGRSAVFEIMLRDSRAGDPRDAAITSGREGETAPAAADLPALLQADAPQVAHEASAILRAALADPARRETLARTLSGAQFAAALKLMAPRRHRLLVEAGALMFAALAATGAEAVVRAGEFAQRPFLLDFLAAQRGRNWSIETLLQAFFDEMVAGHVEASDEGSAGAPFLDAVAASIEARAEAAGMHGLRAAMKRLRPAIVLDLRQRKWRKESGTGAPAHEPPPVPARPRPAPVPRRERAAFAREPRAPVYIDNAGLVLAAPFIPHLFRELGMLEQAEGGGLKLHKPPFATRAIHLLQYLVTARTATPEPLLVLNKIVAGLPTGAVVGAGIDASETELTLCTKVLTSLLANWPALSTGTSVAGLQNTFMQREGRLTFADDKWKLTVERKTLDVLVDQIPWGFRLIYHSWMPQPLHVEW